MKELLLDCFAIDDDWYVYEKVKVILFRNYYVILNDLFIVIY